MAKLLPYWKEVIFTFTRAQVQRFLETRVKQSRPLKTEWVIAIAEKMQLGMWRLFNPTESPIAFDKDGFLINGRHRLYAFLLTGLPTMRFRVYLNCEPDDFGDFDQDIGVRGAAAAHPGYAHVTRDRKRVRQLCVIARGNPRVRITEAVYRKFLNQTYASELALAANVLPKDTGISRAPFVAAFMYAYATDPIFVTKALRAWILGDETVLPKALMTFREDAISGKVLPSRDGGWKRATHISSLRLLQALYLWHTKQPVNTEFSAKYEGVCYFSRKHQDNAGDNWKKTPPKK